MHDGCGASFSIGHDLDCCFGGLVTCRHNKIGDAFVNLASLVQSPVVKEPNVCDGSAGADILIADFCIHATQRPQIEALFDIRVVDTNAWSYCAYGPYDVLDSAEVEKCKYLQTCQDQCTKFTPLCASVDNILGSEADFLRDWVTFGY